MSCNAYVGHTTSMKNSSSTRVENHDRSKSKDYKKVHDTKPSWKILQPVCAEYVYLHYIEIMHDY